MIGFHIYITPERKKDIDDLSDQLKMSKSKTADMLITLGLTAFKMALNPVNQKDFDTVMSKYEKKG